MTPIVTNAGRIAKLHGRIVDAVPMTSCGGVLGRVFPLTKSIGLSTSQTLAGMSETIHLLLTGSGVLGSIHFHICLRVASLAVLGEEATVAAFQDVYLGICQTGVTLSIDSAVLCTYVTCHQRRPVYRVFAVEKQESPSFQRAVEQVRGEQFFIVIINCSIDMTSVIFILKSAINDKLVVVVLVVLAIQDLQERVPGQPGYTVVLVVGEEMRKHRLGGLFHIENGLQP